MIRRIYPTRFGQLHLRSHEGKGVPLILLHSSPRSGAMWEGLQGKLERPTHAPDRLGFGFSDAPPWALSLEQHAQATIDGLQAAGMQGQIDLLGMHIGSLEAIEIASQLGVQVRRVAVLGVPLFSEEELQRHSERYSEQPLRPAAEGGHVLGAWRGGLALREPPYDLAEAHRRFTDHVLAANPGATLRAGGEYALAEKLAALKVPLVVFALHDELIEYTKKVQPLLPQSATYVDLPELGIDATSASLEALAQALDQHLPAS
jgi:pimeloyl-ACP methyl ester carboxylesterase